MQQNICTLIIICFLSIFESLAVTKSIDSIITSKGIKLYYSSETLPFDTIPQMHFDRYYMEAFDELSKMLDGTTTPNLKRAVFLVENAYLSGSIDYQGYCSAIKSEVEKINRFIDSNNLRRYNTCINAALFEYFTKPNWMNNNKAFSYDIVDPGGRNDISKLFITKLMKTHSGQCQSLPIYYKILCNELNGEAYLALCQNHLYLTHIGEDGKWYNIELTT